jgi:ligand-binding sensor domain-containing protein
MALRMRYNPVLCFLICICLILPAGAASTAGSGIFLFRPEAGSVHSTQITDFTRGPEGEVTIATAYGLSTYNGIWSTRHVNRDNFSAGLMDDFVTAVEYDDGGNLWIGYSSGLQVFNGQYYYVIRDQELLKSTQIRALQRWDDEMWVATGNSGIHRYWDGTWTWYPPATPGGSGFYEADSLALDSATNTLLVATAKEGAWAGTRSANYTVTFRQIADKDGTFGKLAHVRQDPLGGAYFFNETDVAHYAPKSGFTSVVSSSDLGRSAGSVNDVAGGSDGALYIATDNGIYVWKEQRVEEVLDRFRGFGTTNSVRTVFTDANNRLWFATPDEVGYYTGTASQKPAIAINTVTPTTPPTPVPQTTVSLPAPTPVPTAVPAASPFDGIVRFFSGFLPFLSPGK